MADLQDAGRTEGPARSSRPPVRFPDSGHKPIADLVVELGRESPAEEPAMEDAGKLEAADRALAAAKSGDNRAYVEATEDLVRILIRRILG